MRLNTCNFTTIYRTHFLRFYYVTAPQLFNILPENLRNERMKTLFLNNDKLRLFFFDYSTKPPTFSNDGDLI